MPERRAGFLTDAQTSVLRSAFDRMNKSQSGEVTEEEFLTH